MLHSSLSSGRQWQSLKVALKPEYQVINPDLLGYGSHPQSYPRPLALSDEAKHILFTILQQAYGTAFKIDSFDEFKRLKSTFKE